MKILLLAAILSLYGTNDSQKEITDRPVTWADFKAPIPSGASLAAQTATTLEYEYEEGDSGYSVSVKAAFLPEESYVRIKSDAILLHENTHWKIAQVVAARCQKALIPYQNKRTPMRIFQKICDSYTKEFQELNVQFDQETNHSVNREAEAEWEARISNELLSKK